VDEIEQYYCIKSSTTGDMSILKLPDEVLQLIISPLSNRDVKNVRLTNRRLASNSKLRIERVFISPSYRNIEVFRAVATHDEFRNQVKEIIWDDAKFRPHFYDEELNPEGWSHDEMGEEFQMRTFEEECNENIGHDPEGGMVCLVRMRTGADAKSDEKPMGLHENVALYRKFMRSRKE
jgi:hypothetical protein